MLGFATARQPVEVPRHGVHLAVAVAWEGVVYGITEGLLLSVLPVLLVWQSGWLAGWRNSGAVLGLIASAAFIAVHHLGYKGLRGPELFVVTAACSFLTVAYLVTGSPLAPIVGYMIMHFGGVFHGTQMPAHAEGHHGGS